LDVRVTDLDLIAIVGAGDEACSLAWRAAVAGCSVRLHDPEPAALEGAQERIRRAGEARVSTGSLAPGDLQRALDGILATADLDEAVTQAILVVEVGARSGGHLRALLMRLGDACRASAVVATATSAHAPDALIDWLPRPGRLLGLRVPAEGCGDRVEIVTTVETSPHAVEVAQRFARRLGGDALVRSGAASGAA
jgi:3-hydroxybutyryl-CoA dehydrogenase